MIVELSVENLAIIERCDLTLGPGFTVFTGETGAGKSLLVDALELAFGARADAGLVRSGASRALVSVTLDLSDRPALIQQCRLLGADVEDGVLYLQREVFAEGRSQCRIGGRLAPVALLKEIGNLLVDLHGQHDHQSLLDPRSHLGFLDAWIGAEVESPLSEVRVRLEKWTELDRRLLALQGSQREREQRIDLLRFQVGEIETVGPRIGETVELEQRLSRLKHAEALGAAVASVRVALIESDPSGQEQIGESVKVLLEAERLDPSLSRIREPLAQSAILLDEALAELRSYEDAIESSPELLEETAARLDAIKRLLRKYGDDEKAVLAFLEVAKAELDLLTSDEEGVEVLQEAVAQARSELKNACRVLTELRRERAGEFARTIQLQLQDLAMDKAQFQVGFQAKEPEADGADAVEFLFSANVGEAVRSLSKIASGGEISRVMLAIKTALTGKAGVPTLIFDEVDTGLGGRAAATVANKIEELARKDQVLVITHLPQIAGKASAHFRVEKSDSGGRSIAAARPLPEAERVDEIARMIAGEEVGESAREHARALLGGSLTP